jgi:hypothetical protein
MADYYPVLARAVAALSNSTPEMRSAIYERARAALMGQLRAVQPPIAEEDIEREGRLLDEAIERLEAEALIPPAQESAPESAPEPAPEPASPQPPEEPGNPPEPLVRRPDPTAGTLPRPNLPPRPVLPPRPTLPPRPGAPTPSAPGGLRAGLGAIEAARQRLAGLARPGARPLPPLPPRPGSDAPVSPPEPAPPPVAVSMPQPTPPAGGDAAAEQRAPVTLRKYGPRAEAAGVSADFPSPDESSTPTAAAPEKAEKAEEDAGGGQRGVRPAAPLAPNERERNLRPLLIGLPVIAVVAAIAVVAYVRRDTTEELLRLRPAASVETSAEPNAGKIVERIGGGQAARPNVPPTPAPSQQGQTAAPAPAANVQAVPVSQRAALLVDAPDDPQRVRTFVGNVVWRLDNVSRGTGQPLAVGVRAEIDLPEARMRAVMLIQKNTDETLPASHTMELRFMPTEGGPIPGVQQISTPQLRKDDTPAGDPLAGVPAPIMRNFFLIGLTRGDLATSRNIDLIRSRGWFDVPMLLSDQRIAKITFEKGAAGERIINEAFDAWK